MKLSKKECIRLKDKYGDWAIVTGASSGIGLELATQLAFAGFNLLVVSRQENKLQELAQTLIENTGSKIKVLAADLSVPEGVDNLVYASRGLAVGLLVVSAGYGTSGNFIDGSLHTELNMIKLNCEALLSVTHYFAQQFVQQKRGGIILMSSMVAFQGTPYAANYAATKAYVQTLSEALSVELKPHGVDVLAAAPGPVSSGFGKRANMKMNMYLTPAQVGVPILLALGRKSTVLPGILTKVLVYSLRTVPRCIKIRIMAKVMGGMTINQSP